ncbi:MAG: hypothetical protein K0S41_249 [Anaerocolumna sp.]|jgi:hypothetical protein|nr:hypothetical protein [Anaerocolumna sp.]
MLFARNSECLKDLRRLISEQKHITLVLWAFECLQIPMNELMSKYPDKIEIRKAYEFSNGWAHGTVKMTIAKRAIIRCDAVAKEMDQEYDIALCHAIGQGCRTVQVETHALSMVLYELSAMVIKNHYKDYQTEVLDKITFYINKLKWCQKQVESLESLQGWADFLIRDDIPNKEKLLLEKENEPIDKVTKDSNNTYPHESSVKSFTSVKKLERLLTLYYNIFKESDDFGFTYDKWRDFLIEDNLKVSKYTVDRYVNELIKTGRVTIEQDYEWSYNLHNKLFTSLEEINDCIRSQEKWNEVGRPTGESRRLLHLIRLIGWLDLFLQYGKISESEINQFYSSKSAKRMVQRDFAFLKEIKSIPLNINRRKISSKENGLFQWFYVVHE